MRALAAARCCTWYLPYASFQITITCGDDVTFVLAHKAHTHTHTHSTHTHTHTHMHTPTHPYTHIHAHIHGFDATTHDMMRTHKTTSSGATHHNAGQEQSTSTAVARSSCHAIVSIACFECCCTVDVVCECDSDIARCVCDALSWCGVM